MEFAVNQNFKFFLNQIKNSNVVYDKIMHLSIYIDSEDEELKKLYIDAAEKHNQKIVNDPNFYDAGFDLFLPKNLNKNNASDNGTRFFTVNNQKDVLININKIDFQVKCCAKIYNISELKSWFTPFYTYARSSLSKTPLRLANNQGIIDAGYRGNLIGMFDCIYKIGNNKDFDWYMEKYSRILQICAPGLLPIYVNVVSNIDDLGPSTARGEGGFGSTGK